MQEFKYEDLEKNIKLIWDEISKTSKITLVTHIDPDGDTIGSSYALKHMIMQEFNDKQVKISGTKGPRYLSFIDDTEYVDDDFFDESLKIVVDTSTISRIGDKRVVTNKSIKIDHHHLENNWLIEIGGDHWPSTGQIIYRFSKVLNIKLSEKIKAGIFIAIWTDTEGMVQRNINDETREAMKVVDDVKNKCIKKMELNEIEKNIISSEKLKIEIRNNITFLITKTFISNDFIRQMVGEFSTDSETEIFVSITKSVDNNFRGEIRSKGNIDVSKIAKQLGGGGHFSSSGFKKKTFREANLALEYILDNYGSSQK